MYGWATTRSPSVSVVLFQEPVVQNQRRVFQANLLRSIRCLQTNLEQKAVNGSCQVICPHVRESESRSCTLELPSKESDGLPKSPNNALAELEPFDSSSIHDVYMEGSKAIVSVKIVPME